MVSRFAAILLCVVVVKTVADDGYDRDRYRPNPEFREYHDNYDDRNKDDYDEYGQRRFRFSPVKAVVDPKYYLSVFDEFEACVAHKCTPFSKVAYAESVIDNLETISKYSSCVTECSAWQFIRVMRNFKRIIAKLYDATSAKLTAVRKYLSDSEYYDILGSGSRIGDSCCLPKDHFVSWDRLFLPVTLSYTNANNAKTTQTGMISVVTYLRVCTTNVQRGLLNEFTVLCTTAWIEYLEALQQNIGHLVLAPKCKRSFPDGNCCEKSVPNPRAETFSDDVCVAVDYVKENGKEERVRTPVIRARNGGKCEDDVLLDKDGKKVTVRYRRVSAHNIDFYTVITGLPSALSNGKCEYTFGLASKDNQFFKPSTLPPGAKQATLNCPTTQTFEYCNPKQLAGYLEKQLFDDAQCDVNEWATYDETAAKNKYYPFANKLTLGCQYRAISLKCDCMETVLNCYTREYEFSTSIGKVLGKASSIMIGFILCQQPKIFSMFGEFAAIDKGQIMRSVLLQAGAMVADRTAIPPATFAFLSFGLGMIAFIVVKASINNFRRRYVKTEDGYRNLI